MSQSTSVIRTVDYDSDADCEAVDRICREAGWIGSSMPKQRAEARSQFLRDGSALFSELAGTPECYASAMPGTFDFHGTALPFSAVTSVITSRVARKQGLASRLTASLVRRAAEEGAVVSGLGMFDQGFYDKLGYGHGGYDHYHMFDPALLNVPYCRRTPVRLSADDFHEMHDARLSRLTWHGAVTLHSPGMTNYMARRSDASFGLGFRDDSGKLTHHLWINPDRPASGPYKVLWMAYTDYSQFAELLGLLRTLGDQVYLTRVIEPGGVQLQDFLDRPFRRHAEAKGGSFETYSTAVANFQYRLLAIEPAIEATRCSDSLSFSLTLNDPIERYLDEGSWKGCGGTYRISLGPQSTAQKINGEAQTTEGTPELVCGVGDFTRLWSGVLPASTLRETGGVSCSQELASRLDVLFGGALPHTDWLY
jgi:GNAT superfamily N-acetyltransferase